MYVDLTIYFTQDSFGDFTWVLNCTHDSMKLQWCSSNLDPNALGAKHLAFQCQDQYTLWVTHLDPTFKEFVCINKKNLIMLLPKLKIHAHVTFFFILLVKFADFLMYVRFNLFYLYIVVYFEVWQ
jgi:hypothetical protein